MKRLLFIILSLCLLATSFAQNSKGTIQGTLQNSKHEPLAGLTVTLNDNQFATSTDEDGFFIFKNIPTGTYTLKVTRGIKKT